MWQLLYLVNDDWISHGYFRCKRTYLSHIQKLPFARYKIVHDYPDNSRFVNYFYFKSEFSLYLVSMETYFRI